MKNGFLFAAVILLLINVSFAQKTRSTSSRADYTALKQQDANLDSLLHTWYVKNSIKKEKKQTNSTPDFLVSETSDSVYIERLQKLPSLFPVSYNSHVKNWIELYIKRNRRTPYLISMSDYYFPIFEEILDSYDLPLELKYLPIIESALNPRAKSRAGAVGLWQFLYSTGKMYGLEVNSYVDERKDPLKSTHAAARFLKDMYEIYGDWALVIAGYNCGPGNVNKAIRRSGGKTNYWEIYPYLPRETRGYVPAFLAAMYTMNYYSEHNIKPKKVEMNIFTDTVMVDKKLHLMQVAEVLNIPFEELIELNPQYRKYIIPGNYKKYSLRLPVKKTSAFIASADNIYKYKDSIYFSGNQIVVKPPSFKRSSYKSYSHASRNFAPPSTKGKKKLFYTVKQGDTYGFIASWYNVRVSALKYWNNTYSNRLSIGQKITVWVPIKKYSYYSKINSKTIAQKQAKSKTSSNSKTIASAPRSKKYIWYKIKQGENLWTIAQKFPGVSDQDLKKINGFTTGDLRRLRAGQYIKIRKRS